MIGKKLYPAASERRDRRCSHESPIALDTLSVVFIAGLWFEYRPCFEYPTMLAAHLVLDPLRWENVHEDEVSIQAGHGPQI